MDLEQTFLKIIEKKHKELNLGQDYNAIFSKIRDFEANAIGQIGEEFLKSVLNAIDEVIDDGIIHGEYDIMTKSGVSFEVKTAQKGRTNNTFLVQWYKPTIQL
ncbi:type II restriction endonuclease [Helicobacter pylori]|uniref:type II restriction endonuclease n=1 Tax=Helicobacter pylori TaxID=210 RepID=UPI002689B299